jgi:hypothetical protein
VTVKELFHHWLKQWGGDMVTHETEVCSDILQYAHDLDAELRDNYPKNLNSARNEALEEAAKILEDHGCTDCTDEIRALKGKP